MHPPSRPTKSFTSVAGFLLAAVLLSGCSYLEIESPLSYTVREDSGESILEIPPTTTTVPAAPEPPSFVERRDQAVQVATNLASTTALNSVVAIDVVSPGHTLGVLDDFMSPWGAVPVDAQRASNTAVYHVPAASFDAVFEAVSDLGTVVHRWDGPEDITLDIQRQARVVQSLQQEDFEGSVFHQESLASLEQLVTLANFGTLQVTLT